MDNDLKRQKYVGRQITREEALAMIEVCKYCELPQAPRVLPDKYFHEEFCWRLRAPGSSFEAADMRECLERVSVRLGATQALLDASSERYLQTIQGLEALTESLGAELEVAGSYGVHMDVQLAEVQKELARWDGHDCYPRDGSD